MNALSKTKCIRLLVAFGLCLMLAGPLMLLWASRTTTIAPKGTDDDALGRALDQNDERLAARMRAKLPPVTLRPADYAVFGDAFSVARRDQTGKKGLLRTTIADIDPANVDATLRDLPGDLKFSEAEITRVGTKGMLAAGVNYIMLRPEAIASKGLDAVLERLRGQVKTIISYGPNSTIVAYVEPRHFGALRQNEDIRFIFAMQPADKIDLQTGKRPLIERARALDTNFLLEVDLVPGSDVTAVKGKIEKIPGVVDVANYGFDGSGLLVKVDHKSLDKLVRIPELLHGQELLEFMENNAKNGPTMQVGSATEGLDIRPFDDLGVDGGGIDSNGDGQRNNAINNPDPVPPQIVGVLDNGISADTASFSQTATQVSDGLAHIFPSPNHRKVHSIIQTRDNGNDCDAVLDGGGSHGNTVASVIAAYPSQLGVFATDANKTSISGQIFNANLDGVARGARIIVTDLADRSQCTQNALVEKGGNVNPGRLRDRLNELICPKSGGTGACAGIVGGENEVHLAITPFGAPDNFQTSQFLPTNGTYPQQSADIDVFLYNNRDFMVVAPVGNNGANIGNNRPELWLRIIPDLLNGTAADDCPVPCTNPHPKPIQVAPPSTAKNLIAVGTSRSDCMTVFGNNDCQANHATFSSRGPATPESLRMAPILFAPGSDLIGNNFETSSIAVFRSRDDDNLIPIDNQIDEGNFGTSYSAANVMGEAALVRDYFAQGLYPTGDRVAANRVPNVSGALVKAALIASAKFGTNVRTQGEEVSEKAIRRTRGMDLGTVAGVNVGVMGNSEQGYGLPILSHVLPLPNWSKNFVLGIPNGNRTPAGAGLETLEYPARAVLIWDDLATGEAPIDNAHTSQTHSFFVSSPQTVTNSGGTGGLAVNHGQMRVGLAWTDPPSNPASGGPLVNDLDLVLESPGPDNCLRSTDTKPDGSACPATAANDNLFYDGNVYPGTLNQFSDQWSKLRTVGQPETHDCRNPQEAIHLTWDLSNDADASNDSQIYVGRWEVTVKRSTTSAQCPPNSGGTTPGQITVTGANEDTGNTQCTGAGAPFGCCTGAGAGSCTGNRRLDSQNQICTGAGTPVACCTGLYTGNCPTEDANANGWLDLGGQTYALLVSGPVFHDAAEAAPAKGPTSFPSSSISVDKIRYTCSDNLLAEIFDGTAGSGVSRSTASTTFTVKRPDGTILDTETGIGFSAGSVAGVTRSSGVPIRLATGPAVPNDGILEADNGMLVFATYAAAGQSPVAASARVDCTPNFLPGQFLIIDNNAVGPTLQVAGGCDNDENLDAGETVTYGIALLNRGRGLSKSGDDYGDVTGTLTPSGPGAGAIRVLDSPKNLGRLPASAVNGLFFHVFVDPTLANALPAASRKVTMTLTLDSLNKGQRMERESFAFTSAINADRQTFHYSTDFPTGGREIRDLNRNQVIDKPDQLDPFLRYIVPDEDVTFSTLFTTGVTINGTPTITNLLGEDLNNNGVLDPNEMDIIPNSTLDRGILFSATGPSSGDKVPWHFDTGNGGWVPVRHPGSTPGTLTANPLWEYMTSGLCGYQSSGSGNNHYGIWHTGDGNPATPGPSATACEDHSVPQDPNTENNVEVILDILHSPIIAKVHQEPDSLGFNYGVEFQRIAFNLEDQEQDASYNGVGLNIDNNLDEDGTNCFFCQELDAYYARRFGGWPRMTADLAGYGQQYFGYSYGIDPASPPNYVAQRTFGPFNDPNGGTPIDGGGETGFTGFTQNSNPDSKSPIPTAGPFQLKFPLAGQPVPGVCTGGPTPGGPCQANSDCGTGGTCTLETFSLTTYGPVRNWDASLVGFEGGLVTDNRTGLAATERDLFYTPGTAGNRWAIAFGFYGIESPAHLTDYGWGLDDVVFEWDEFHPGPETTPACSRFNTPGNPAGGQCATLTADRTNLYECEESMEITVMDPKLPANTPSVQVNVVTDSDSNVFSTNRFSVFRPNSKSYTLNAVAGSPGFFRGTVAFSGTANTPNNVFVNPSTDSTFIVYYVDPGCDGDGDGQAGEDLFNNLDGDGVLAPIDGGTDNCPLIYNPNQADADGDGVGDLCDNCVNVANPTQADVNTDGVGDACEYDDVDGDGRGNSDDNCPDVYNPGQEPGTLDHGAACSSTTQDLDGDGKFDFNDNCVLTANANQKNSDGDRLGDACDGDCAGITVIHICSNAPGTVCTTDSQCPALPAVPGPHCQTAVSHAVNAACSTVDDDADLDGVTDHLDNCPDIYNPTIIPGSNPPRQLDSDRDGLGDECDPSGSLDDDFNGVPDDIVTFTGTLSCRVFPLARLAVLDADYVDLDGDHDPFPDTGETGIVQVRVKNLGFSLTDAAFTLTSADPNVACIISPTVSTPSLPANAEVVLGSLNPADPQLFKFRASDTLNSTNPAAPTTIQLCLGVTANESLGTASPACFKLLADISAPGGALPYVAGPDGITGTSDDGTIFESFDNDRDGDGKFTVNDTFRSTDAGTGVTSHGFYMHGTYTGIGSDLIAGTPCGGFLTPLQNNPGCILDPDFPMDWHLHCPPNNPALCPNNESGTFTGGVKGGCQGCSFNTPADGAKAFTPPNSLHMGAHFDLALSTEGDTTHFRTLQAFVSSPINLALGRRAGHPEDLTMSFYHIVDLMDNEGFGPGNANQCADCADVQIQVDRDQNAAVDDWGPWDKLVPSVNVYDHKADAFSTVNNTTCLQTPTDTGTAAPAPRGVHETICFPQGAWSHCGHPTATTSAVVVDCAGPGVVDPSGKGVWVQTQFNLKPYLGGRVRIRWIGETWTYLDSTQQSYFETGPGWSTSANDDGWWLDNITIGGALTQQTLPVLDPRPIPPGSSCPTNPATFCDETTAATDKGTLPQIKATDLNGVIFDGSSYVPRSGHSVRISGVASTIPGGCTNGVPQFQFTKNGSVVQDWSSKTFFQDSPEQIATYSVQVRCSSDTSCTSVTGATVTVPVYSGTDGVSFGSVHSAFDATTGVQYTAGTGATTLNLYTPTGFQVDVYRGNITSLGSANGGAIDSVPPNWDYTANTACFKKNQNPTAGNVAVALTQTDDPNPTVGTATFYVADAAPANQINTNLGCVNPSRCRLSPFAFCATDSQCAGAGNACLNALQAGPLQGNQLQVDYGCPTSNASAYKLPSVATAAQANACMP